MKTSVALGTMVLFLVSTIDGSFATSTSTTTMTTDHPKGWNIALAFRGGSMTTLQQQEQQAPPPPPPMQGEARDDHDRRYREYTEKLQLREKHPHQLQLHEQQQQQHWHQQQHGEYYHSNDGRSRGVREDLSWVLPKKIDLKQVTKVLLHTSETNRKMHQGVSHWERNKRSRLATATPTSSLSPYSRPPQGRHQHPYGMYGNLPVNVHPSRTWQPSIREFSGRTFEDEELTLFHAKIPRSRSSSSGEAGDAVSDTEMGENDDRTDTERSYDENAAEQLGAGASYWGPDLLPYLEHILHDLLGVDEEGSEMLLVLTMIYLDRACSVETPRTNQHGVGAVPPCPFCAPRTVHRLSLSALVVATKAFRQTHHRGGDDDAAVLSKLSRSLGIPLVQLRQMVEWMVLALGDDGLYVDSAELRAWSRSWDSFFPPEEIERSNGIEGTGPDSA